MANTTPSIIDSFVGLRTITEDTLTNITNITISDPDTTDTQTVVLSVNQGILNLNITTGVTVTNNGTGTVTLVGFVADINNALGSLSYTPNLNYNGDDTLTITVSDGVDNTDTVNDPPNASSAIDATLNIPLSIIAVNDAPTLNPTALTVAEGGEFIFTVDQLGLRDPDLDIDAATPANTGTGQQVLAQQIVKITAIPTHGTLRLGTQILQVGSVFSYDQLNTVKYIHDGSDVSPGDTDLFKITVNDGGGGESAETTVNINLTPVNKPPTIGGSGTVFEGYDAALNVSAILGDNADLPANATVTIVSTDLNGEGTLYLDNNNNGTFDSGDTDLSSGGTFTADKLNLLRFSHGGNETNLNDKPKFVINVQDSGGGTGVPATSANTTVEITVTPVNDDPILVNNHEVSNPLSVAGASTTILTTADLLVTDADNPPNNQLVYTLQSRPTKGVIQLNVGGDWKTLGIGGFFTQEQLNSGLVRYVQEVGVTANTPDSFDFVVRDSAFTIGPNGPIREGGVRTLPNDPNANVPLAVKTFNIKITTDNFSTVTTPGDPSPGYGGTTPGGGSPTLDATVDFTNNNFTNIAQGDRTQEGGSGILTQQMLNFVFVNSNAVQVPANQTVYTLLNLPDNGTLEQWNGSSWVPLSVGSTFTQADINKGVLTTPPSGVADAGVIRFKHDGSENFTSTFDYTVSVGGDIRINTMASSTDDYKPFTIDIIPTNDTPTITQAQPINLPEGGVTTIEPAKVKLDDADNHPIDKPNNPLVLLPSDIFRTNEASISYFKVDTLPSNGTLFIDANENGVIDAGETVTASTSISKADLNSGKVKFNYDSSFNTFTFIDTLGITAYDASNNVVSGVTNILFSPEKFAFENTLEFKFVNLPDHGTLFIDANNNNQFDSGEEVNTTDYYASSVLTGNQLKYLHNGTENFLDTFQVQGKDNHGAVSGITTVTIDIYPVNDAPLVPLNPSDADPTVILPPDNIPDTGANNPLTVDEGATGTITNDLLKAVDPDNSTTQRQFRITDNVDNGQLLLNGKPLGVGSTFTQKDIDEGKLSYKHNGLEVFTDRFYFRVSDGDKTTDVAYFDININPLNDKATLTAPKNLDVTASGTNYVAVPAVTVDDVDLTAVASPQETDFLRVELQVLDGSNNLVTGALLNYTASNPSSTLGFNSGKGTNSLIVQGTKAEIDAVLASLQVAFTNDEDATNYKIKVTVDDRLYDSSGNLTSGANGGNANQDGTTIDATNNRVSKEILLNVSNVNDPPTLTNGSSYSVNEEGTVTLSGFSLSDVDSFDKDVTAVVRLYTDAGATTLADASKALLQLGATTGLTTATGNNSNEITLTGSVSEIQNALNDLKLKGSLDFNNGPLYVKTTFTDYTHAGVTNEVSVTNTVNFVPINDAPVLTVPSSAFNLVGGVTNISLPGVSFQDDKDVDQGASDSFTVTIVAPNAGDTLAATVSGSATSSYDSGSKTLTITGNKADINATLANLVYTPVNPNADITATLVVTVNDGGNGDEGGTSTGNQTATGNIVVNISNTNDPPVNILPSPLTVLEDSSNNAVTGIQISDSDDFGANLTVVLTPTNGSLNFSSATAGVTVSGLGTTASPYTLVGTEANINTHLNKLRFTPTPDLHGPNGIASIRVTTTDTPLAGSGSAQTDTDDYLITITPRNDHPTANKNPNLPTASTEDVTTPPTVAINSLDFGYSDNTDNRTGITNSITGVTGGDTSTPFSYVAIVGNAATAAQGTWQVSDGSGGWITIPTTGLRIDGALIFPSSREVRFVPAPDFHGTPGTLTVRLADNSVDLAGTNKISTSNTVKFNLTTAANGGTGVTGAWNNTDRFIGTSVSNINDRPTANATTTITGTEDSPSSPLTVTGTAFGYSDSTDDRTSIPGGGNASTPFGGIAIVGNSANPTTQGTWQYNTGSDWKDVGSVSDSAALILPENAQLRFVPSANFNGTPAPLNIRVADTPQSFNNNADITGNLTQTSTWSEIVNLSASISPQNDAPTVTATVLNPAVTENNTTASGTSIDPVNLLNNSVVSDLDLTTTGGLDANTFGAGTITVTLTDGVAGDVLQVSTLPPGVTITGGNGNTPLVITLDNDTTLTEVQDILNAIQYKSTSDNPTNFGSDVDRTYTVVINDGNNVQSGGNAGGPNGLNATTTLSGTITINPTNDPPTIDLNPSDNGTLNHTATFTEMSVPDTGANAVSFGFNNGSGINVSDPDSRELSKLTITINSITVQTGDQLRLGTTVIDLTSATGSGTVTYGGTTFAYNVSDVGGNRTITFTKNGGGNAPLTDFETLVDNLKYNSSSDHPTGSRVFSTTVTDDDNLISSPATFTVNLQGVNDAPSGSNNTVTTQEDTNYVFKAADFGFSDVDGNNFSGVYISSLPSGGQLIINNGTTITPVDLNTVVNIADINSGFLQFRPDDNQNKIGSAYSSFTFQVEDDGGTDNGGSNRDPIPNTLSINVTPVNDRPVAKDVILADPKYTGYGTPKYYAISNLFNTTNGNFNDSTDQISGGSSANSFLGVAIVGNAATTAQGQWQYLAGRTWTNIGSVSDTNALTLAPTTQIRFLPATGFTGTPGALSVRVIDNNNGAGTAFGTLTNGQRLNLNGKSSGLTSPTSAISNPVTINTKGTVNTPPVINELDKKSFHTLPSASGSVTDFVISDKVNPVGVSATLVDAEAFKIGGTLKVTLDSANFYFGGDTTRESIGFGSRVTVNSVNNTLSIGGQTIGTFTLAADGGTLDITFTKQLTPAEANTLIQNITYGINEHQGLRKLSFIANDSEVNSNRAEVYIQVSKTPWKPDNHLIGDVSGQPRSDTITGTFKNDLINGKGANDALYGHEGNDLIISEGGVSILDGDVDNDTLIGSYDSDVMRGADGDDLLIGNGGNDRMSGGSGNDILVGGTGGDSLLGDSGADYFVYPDSKDSLFNPNPNSGSYDYIMDFNSAEGDKIVTRTQVTEVIDGGTISSLNEISTATVLSSLGVGEAAVFILTNTPTQYFLAINQSEIGFDATVDTFIRINTPSLTASDFTTLTGANLV